MIFFRNFYVPTPSQPSATRSLVSVDFDSREKSKHIIRTASTKQNACIPCYDTGFGCIAVAVANPEPNNIICGQENKDEKGHRINMTRRGRRRVEPTASDKYVFNKSNK